ncbi:hypothetical protein ACFP47_12355 [Nesterenkonia lacusekhoensis]|uniref:hypothetical protein n=1 Tax=Nesterenkonia lacusekhoensis TaxID=150832 RepID=UPI003618FF50
MTVVEAWRLRVDLLRDAADPSSVSAGAGLLITAATSTSTGTAAGPAFGTRSTTGASARACSGLARALTWIARRRLPGRVPHVDVSLNLDGHRALVHIGEHVLFGCCGMKRQDAGPHDDRANSEER